MRSRGKYHNSRLSPLLFVSCLDELRLLDTTQHFAEGEADSCIAELADRLGGYMISQGAARDVEGQRVTVADSDFFIHPSRGRYIPLDSIMYDGAPFSLEGAATASTLSFRSYSHLDIARLFSLPTPSLLPLLAALVGNDQGGLPVDTGSFAGHVDKATFHTIASHLAKLGVVPLDTEDALRLAIVQVLPSLLSAALIDDALVLRLVRSAQSYGLVPIESHSPTFPLNPVLSDTPAQVACRAVYSEAFRAGELGAALLMVLRNRVFSMNFGLDDPSRVAPNVQLGQSSPRWHPLTPAGRPLRLLMYGIMHDLLKGGPIIELVRRGELLYECPVPIQTLAEMGMVAEGTSPIITQSVDARLAFFRYILHAPDATPTLYLSLVCSLRHIQFYAKTKWTSLELLSALAMGVLLESADPVAAMMLQRAPVAWDGQRVQRSTELVVTLFSTSLLLQVLCLTSVVGMGYDQYGGTLLHTLLAYDAAEVVDAMRDGSLVWDLLALVEAE